MTYFIGLGLTNSPATDHCLSVPTNHGKETRMSLENGRIRLNAVSGLSAKKAAEKYNGLKDPDTNLPVTARQIAKARQGRIFAIERLGRAT